MVSTARLSRLLPGHDRQVSILRRRATQRAAPRRRADRDAVGRDNADRFYSLMPAFEVGPSARHSPGLLHLEETIAWCVRERIAILDLGVGDELYKLRIANARLPLFRENMRRL